VIVKLVWRNMQVPLLGNLDWSDWLRGVAGGFIGGGAAALTSTGTLAGLDPAYFAAHPPGYVFKLMGILFVSNGVVGAALFLKQKPVPEVKTQETSMVTTETSPAGAVTETKVQQKTTEPVPVPIPVVPKETHD
jgi:hypothetical protein